MSSKPLPSFGDKLKNFSYNACSDTLTDENGPSKALLLLAKSLKRSPPSLNPTNELEGLPNEPLKKKQKKKKAYVGPEAYSHLSHLTPLLRENLICVFVGFNPGIETAIQGHYYAHCSNLFWKLIYESGCVNRKVSFIDDQKLPDEFGYGFHDLVTRPTKGIDELSASEMLTAVPTLEADLQPFAPRIICIVGKGIWEKIYRFKTQKPLKSFEWGVQYRPGENDTRGIPFLFAGGKSIIVVLPSTSGLVTSPSRSKKTELWKSLAQEIETLRQENKSSKTPVD
ncbi:uncharacterized protein SAPINGB_P001100 [Magnusiomyces paraingens]|uniref:Uracil-DNA glycosylase-like domain-containing protein n=1 Tax=Magnusiomyces paraingens TaxID=2606893 RepID=A0A5E8B400_9ASCO|nr:uncharacterized protein SAPINGB_P001100 [Saprochaete ingens]VVT46209.1 unnamed protein product [Saprochaete ingens]